MRRYSFEIIRRGFDRFSWVFVEVFEGRRRVLARADRDFRSRKRARRAVLTLQEVAAGAEVIDATGDDDPFDLPATSFEIAPYALPLVVGPPPITRGAAVGRRRRSRTRSTGVVDDVAGRPSDGDVLVEDSAAEAVAASPADANAAASEKAPARAAATGAARDRTVKKAGRGTTAARARSRR